MTGWDLLVGPGVADLTRTPSSIIHEAPQCTVRRYRSRRRARADRSPVLLVPPLAAPATCFDLRRGCSLAEHLTALGYPTYLVDYGAISFSDRALGPRALGGGRDPHRGGPRLGRTPAAAPCSPWAGASAGS